MAGYVEEGCVECALYPRHKVVCVCLCPELTFCALYTPPMQAMQRGRSCVVDRACSLSVQGSVAAVASVPLETTVAEASEVSQAVSPCWEGC